MNFFKPAELNGTDLRSVTRSLERNGVTQLETIKYGVKTLLIMNDGRWQAIQDGVTSTLFKTKNGWRVRKKAA